MTGVLDAIAYIKPQRCFFFAAVIFSRKGGTPKMYMARRALSQPPEAV